MNVVAAGYANSFFIDENYDVWGCGLNTFLGNGDLTMPKMTRIDKLKNICAVDTGFSSSIFLDDEGRVWRTPQTLPTSFSNAASGGVSVIENLPRTKSIVASYHQHSLFLDVEGFVWGCGSNFAGELGSYAKMDQPDLINLQLPRPIKAIDAGWRHSVFLDEEGSVWACGNNNCGELGLGPDRLNRSKPEKVVNLPEIKAVFCGCQHTMFLAADGSVWGTGSAQSGELTNVGADYISTPVKLHDLPRLETLSLGWNHTLFLDTDREVWSCGSKVSGAIGSVITSHRFTPSKVLGLPIINHIAAGSYHSLFVDGESSLWCCGNMNKGQLGLPSSSSEPTKIANIPPVIHQNLSVKSARAV